MCKPPCEGSPLWWVLLTFALPSNYLGSLYLTRGRDHGSPTTILHCWLVIFGYKFSRNRPEIFAVLIFVVSEFEIRALSSRTAKS